MCVWTTCPVNVHVDDEIRAAQMTQKKTVVWHSLKIAHDALHGRQMWLSRVMHMQTYLLHGVNNVRPCEDQVMESPCNASKLRSVLNRRPRVCSELHL
jgi:hypothetical protein